MKATGFSRVSKNLIIDEITREIKSKPVFFVADHSGLSASSLDKLRAKLRAAKARYVVVKNSLGRKAFEKAALGEIGGSLKGSTGIAFTSGDPVVSSKALMEFAKENESFKLQTGFVNGQVIGADQIKVLANLPSREVLIARVVGGIQAPLSRLVGVLAGTMRKAVTVLDAIARKKGGGS